MYRVVTAKHILRTTNNFRLVYIFSEKKLTPLPQIILQHVFFCFEATAVEHVPCTEVHPTQSSLYGLRITGEDLRGEGLRSVLANLASSVLLEALYNLIAIPTCVNLGTTKANQRFDFLLLYSNDARAMVRRSMETP